jgi:membrane associated rhomboid family serine protease
MIPLGDASRRPVNFPIVTVFLIAINAIIFIIELISGDAFINRWSLVPAGWAHILGNMLFFWVFGPEIEDVMGRVSFLIFYLLGGLAATFAQIAISPASTIPNLGASGAIAAVMGAFIITYPRDRIRTVLFFGWFVRVTLLPAVLLVGFWFLTQLLNEVGAIASVQSGGVAYMAHIGGFIFGALTARLFESRRRRLQQGLE